MKQVNFNLYIENSIEIKTYKQFHNLLNEGLKKKNNETSFLCLNLIFHFININKERYVQAKIALFELDSDKEGYVDVDSDLLYQSVYGEKLLKTFDKIIKHSSNLSSVSKEKNYKRLKMAGNEVNIFLKSIFYSGYKIDIITKINYDQNNLTDIKKILNFTTRLTNCLDNIDKNYMGRNQPENVFKIKNENKDYFNKINWKDDDNDYSNNTLCTNSDNFVKTVKVSLNNSSKY